ncbi:MAG TPA: SH3 domain-containing protein [Acetobacteraceae bacterium]|nr:SH3 domain-containing protein [Acetobacteraceae bacterium]
MTRTFYLLACMLMVAGWTAPALGPGPGPALGIVTSLPVPRFVSLRTDDVNMRAGPGFQYPIIYDYKRAGLPVEIIGEFDVWRHVVAPDGGIGWVHEATVRAERGFIVTGAQHVIRAAARDDAAPVAYAEPGVIGRILSCDAALSWCRVSADHRTGWLKRDDFWGAFAGEAIK